MGRWLRESPLNRQWLNMGPFKCYFRKGPMSILGYHYDKVITLADVTSSPEKSHTGKFKPILQWMDARLADKEVQALFVENVFSPRLAEILENNKWDVQMDHFSHVASYYKEIDQ
jgi:hypothetical protein